MEKYCGSKRIITYFALRRHLPSATSTDGREVLRVNVRPKRRIFCVFGVSKVYVRYDPDVLERGREGGGRSALFSKRKKLDKVGEGS